MAELRQRRGGGQERGEGPVEMASPEDRQLNVMTREEAVQEAEKMLAKIREGPKPGLSHEAKGWKDALREDPYNLELIFKLGLVYARDQQWTRCSNVMLRGFKRVSEFDDPLVQTQFLMTLCQASMYEKKFRQALAVFADITEPEDEDLAKRYEALKCFVYCSNGDASTGLKAFHKAIEGQDFDAAVSIWSLCYPGLQKVGAIEVTRSTLEGMTTDESMKKRVKLVEMLREMKHGTEQDVVKAGESKALMIRFILILLLVFMCIAGYILHSLEAKNLERLKLKL